MRASAIRGEHLQRRVVRVEGDGLCDGEAGALPRPASVGEHDREHGVVPGLRRRQLDRALSAGESARDVLGLDERQGLESQRDRGVRLQRHQARRGVDGGGGPAGEEVGAGDEEPGVGILGLGREHGLEVTQRLVGAGSVEGELGEPEGAGAGVVGLGHSSFSRRM